LIQNARRRGTPISISGRDVAGTRSSDLDGVLTVDLSSWQHVDVPNRERLSVTVEPGASFRQILAKTLPLGLVPRTAVWDLDASLGGSLSGVGVGGTSHRHGFLAEQVVYAQVILGTGEVVHTGPATERDVFDGVFGGAGRFGVITSVELKLEPVAPRVVAYCLSYEESHGLVHDLLQLGQTPDVLHLVAGATSLWPSDFAGVVPRRARYCLVATLAASPDADAPPPLPPGLSGAVAPGSELQSPTWFSRSLLQPSAAPLSQLTRGARSDWVLLLPETLALPMLLEHILETMAPSHACAVNVVTQHGPNPTALASPATERVLAVSGRALGPSDADDYGALSEVQQRVYRAGGRLCPKGWLARRDAAFWRTHYASNYPRLSLLKRLFDPASILTSAAGPLRASL
jgi:FAD/FMN-containing dehydrogenase